MNACIDELKSQMSLKALQDFESLNLNRIAKSVRRAKNILIDKTEKEKLDQLNYEMEIFIQREENDVNGLRKILCNLKEDLDALESFNFNDVETIKMKGKVSDYKSRIQRTLRETTFDVSELETIHNDTKAVEKEIAKVDEELLPYKGLPPNIAEARIVVENLTREVENLNIDLAAQINNEIKSFTTPFGNCDRRKY